MSGRKPKKARKRGKAAWYESYWLAGLLLLAVAAYLGLSLTGGVGPWWNWVSGDRPGDLLDQANPGGLVGSVASVGLHGIFGGVWCWVFPVYLAVLGFGYLTKKTRTLRPWLLRAVPLWVASSAWIAQQGGPFSLETGARYGGGVGYFLAMGFQKLFGTWGAHIFLTVILLTVILVVFRPWLGWIPGLADGFGAFLGQLGGGLLRLVVWPFRLLGRGLKSLGGVPAAIAAWNKDRKQARARQKDSVPTMARPREPEPDSAAEIARQKEKRRLHDMPVVEPVEAIEPVTVQPAAEELVLPGAAGEFMGEGEAPVSSEDETRVAGAAPRKKKKKKSGPVVLPGVDLLTPAGPETQTVSTAELDAAADLLEATLRSFGVEGEVKDVRPGPVVTTFEFQPGHGIKVSQIVQRSDDLALAMRARSIRMEAPIPGKAAVGIEIPNPVAKMVRLREVVELVRPDARNPLQVVLGKDVVGRPVSIDIASLPHLLVAGSTGSGKSVCLNALISNLLLRNDPSTLRMVLIDPKMLEMSVYNGIPHLLLPVVTDPKEALKALQWMVAQMEYRYRNLAKWSVRNI